MIDFHCHLDLYPDPTAVVAACRERGDHVLSVTTPPRVWRGTLGLARGAPRIRTALGLHPELAHLRHGELPLFEGLLSEARYVGEVGLDGSPELRPHQEVQRRCFGRILRACAAGEDGYSLSTAGVLPTQSSTLTSGSAAQARSYSLVHRQPRRVGARRGPRLLVLRRPRDGEVQAGARHAARDAARQGAHGD